MDSVMIYLQCCIDMVDLDFNYIEGFFDYCWKEVEILIYVDCDIDVKVF